jgi:alpha-L-fucosidase
MILKKTSLMLLGFCLILYCADSQSNFSLEPSGSDVQKPDMAVKSDTSKHSMQWWRDARFGMFIHWGVFSVPTGYYNGKPVHGDFCDYSEWIMYNAKIPMASYQVFAKQFNPVKFDADAWVKIAKDAGMKYIIITTKHHDGFAMFCSKVSKWNICDASPFGRDPLKELTAACNKYGIKLGFYYSQAQDWNNGGSVWGSWDGVTAWAGKKWDKTQERSMDDYIDRTAVPQVRELLTNYGDNIPAIIWWDTPFDMNKERAEKLNRTVQELKPGIIMNNRLGGGFKGDTETPEQYIPPKGYPGSDWETCMTMNDSWGYKRDDNNWKSAETLIRNLCDIASKGGNYLLNVGPTSKGLIPQPSLERLAEIGKWMRVNGEAIYGSGPTPFGNEAERFSSTEKESNGQPKFIQAWDWRCTAKPGKIYLLIFQWPKNQKFELASFHGKITKAYLLTNHKDLKTEQTAAGVTVSLPAQAPDKFASVVCLEVVDQAAKEK